MNHVRQQPSTYSNANLNSSPSDALARYRHRLLSSRSSWGGKSCAAYPRPTVLDLVSIITVSFNSEKTIKRTIDSVAAQRYHPIEHIVIDGCSKDGTLAILSDRNSQLDLWISEPDHGISDAFNKGIALASGEFIAIVNSDDWLEPTHISDAVRHLRDSNCDFAFGNVEIHDEHENTLYKVLGDPAYAKHIARTMPALNHPSIVAHRRLYEAHGLYDTSYGIAMDYEWLLRVHRRGARGIYVSSLTSHMENTGISNTQTLKSLKEVHRAAVSHGYSRLISLILYHIRATKVTARQFIEKHVSHSAASTIRSFVNPRYKPIRPHSKARDEVTSNTPGANKS